MSELVRTVPSGSVGLDLVLGGGVRVLHRIAGMPAESATILVRGGPGVGKSVLAADTALRIARALGGDVLYVCIEILPSEVIAQRMGFDGFDPTTVIDLANGEAQKDKDNTTDPTLVVGMTAMEMGPPGDTSPPDLGQMILDLLRISYERGCKPLVVVVDSLTDGYNLGASVPREIVDGVCKLAVEQGWVLVLVEETVNNDASPWSFAVDTVVSLEVTAAGRREARVTKHRFGPCEPGPHRLLVEREGVRVLPCFAAYRNAVRDLRLPAPAVNRSLRWSVAGKAPNWKSFDLSDQQGYVLVVDVDSSPDQRAVDKFVATIGATANDGSLTTGARLTLKLSESDEFPLRLTHNEFHVGSLHQMIDGEEWLEKALSHIAAIASPLAQVVIGPTNRLDMYEHRDTLGKAITVLLAILNRCGLLVVVYGKGSSNIIRAAVVSEVWMDSSPENSPAERRTFLRHANGIPSEFEVRIG